MDDQSICRMLLLLVLIVRCVFSLSLCLVLLLCIKDRVKHEHFNGLT